jgi:hypothetical protein
VVSAVVSGAPGPPSGLVYEWDAAQDKLVVRWDASPSPDVAGYRVRSGDGTGVELGGVPVQDSGVLQYEQVLVDVDGVVTLSVRAVDVDGHEEANIAQVLAVPFTGGSPVGLPAEPARVRAVPLGDGRVEFSCLYLPRLEDGSGGAAQEMRVYGDAGSGVVDYSEPLGTVAMGGPAEAGRWSFVTDALADGTYRFVVRIATAAWPGGVETENVGEVSVTVNGGAVGDVVVEGVVV